MTQQQTDAMPATSTETGEQHLRDYLRGYARNDAAKLRLLMQYPGWQRAAVDEQQRRARRLIEVLDDDLLEAIATRTVHFEEVAKQLADELDGKKA